MNRARWNVQYSQRVLSTNPIAYWIQDEKQGNVAYDMVSGRVAGAQNGAITGSTLGQFGIGDGRTSFFYDGANDFTNILTPTFAGAFNGDEGTIALQAQTNAWLDGTARFSIVIFVDGANFVWLRKRIDVSQFNLRYVAGGVTNTINISGLTTALFNQYVITWSVSADEVRAFMNGVQQGATLNGLGVWSGTPVLSVIGAQNTAPSLVWNGLINHVSVWNRALPPTTVEFLYQESF